MPRDSRTWPIYTTRVELNIEDLQGSQLTNSFKSSSRTTRGLPINVSQIRLSKGKTLWFWTSNKTLVEKNRKIGGFFQGAHDNDRDLSRCVASGVSKRPCVHGHLLHLADAMSYANI